LKQPRPTGAPTKDLEDKVYDIEDDLRLDACTRVHTIGKSSQLCATRTQYLAFIFHYTKIHGYAPAEADMQRYFRVSPPTVHQMILTLGSRGLVE